MRVDGFDKKDYETRDGYLKFWEWENKRYQERVGRWFPIPIYIIDNYLKEKQYKSVIDFGCGSHGRGYDLLFSEYQKYIGVDINDIAVNEAKKRHIKNKNAEFKIIDIDPDKWELPKVDLVYCFTVLVHILPEHIEKTIKKLLSVCREAIFIELDSKIPEDKYTFYCYKRNYRELVKPDMVLPVPNSELLLFIKKGQRFYE